MLTVDTGAGLYCMCTQTVHTLFKLFLKEQSDQGLHCVPSAFTQHCNCRISVFKFSGNENNFNSGLIFSVN